MSSTVGLGARTASAPAANARPPRVAGDAGGFNLTLARIGDTNVYCRDVTTLSHGTAFTWHYEVGDRRIGGGQLEVYTTPPDSSCATRRPEGHGEADAAVGEQDLRGDDARLVGLRAGTVPAGIPAAVMVFQDGSGPKDYVPVDVRQSDCQG